MFTFEMTNDAGEKSTVEATPRDVLAWEKTTKGARFGQLADTGGLSLEATYKIAWLAARRLGVVTSVSLAEFEQDYDVLPIAEDDADPTNEDR